jgi:hypothetical protein
VPSSLVRCRCSIARLRRRDNLRLTQRLPSFWSSRSLSTFDTFLIKGPLYSCKLRPCRGQACSSKLQCAQGRQFQFHGLCDRISESRFRRQRCGFQKLGTLQTLALSRTGG